jgi:hypothetical protein
MWWVGLGAMWWVGLGAMWWVGLGAMWWVGLGALPAMKVRHGGMAVEHVAVPGAGGHHRQCLAQQPAGVPCCCRVHHPVLLPACSCHLDSMHTQPSILQQLTLSPRPAPCLAHRSCRRRSLCTSGPRR